MNDTDPRVKRTRKLLQDAFFALIAEQGFHATTVQDIAERATVNRATFYAHFEDKYALLDHVVRDWFHETLEHRLASAAPFTAENLHLLVVAVLEHFVKFHNHCKPADRDLEPLIEAKVQEEIHEVLAGWLTTLPPRDGASTAAAATVASWAIFGAGLEWGRRSRTKPVDERATDARAREVVVLVTGGLERAVRLTSPGSTNANRVARQAVSVG